ncbi:DUF58 domain-containing protein [Paenibacillus sp. JX-17]|uniref:DUF58 domain-containing protein n=1 Tax=Paenibacillus lacisoli TaxID=3064525 RepID=A0ABT9CAE3_9BACL|nr:DUF58 domain-containing protein [Paenibacillus sp. JX-17]MDO7905513.1 DUF58 domain-containing protein [Paenibacillus sp. JX-17]
MSKIRTAGRTGKPSFKIWMLLAVWLVCLLYVLFQGGKTSFMLLSMVTLFGVYLWLGAFSGVRRVRGRRHLVSGPGYSDLLHAGDQVHVQLDMQIPGFMPLPYMIVRDVLKRHTGESWSFEESVIPNMKGKGELTFQTPPLERGLYHFAATESVTEDIFGLMEHKGRFAAPGEFRVLPRSVFIPYWHLFDRNSRLSGRQTTLTKSRRETTQINGVRDYVYGDRLSRIHWNATAKTGTWKSKEFEHESIPKIMLVLDTIAEHYTRAEQFELAVSTTASLLDYGTRERLGVGLCTAGDKTSLFAPSEGMSDRQRMLHHLVDLSMQKGGGLQEQLENQLRLFPQGSFFVLISPLTGDRALQVLRWAESRGFTPCHIGIQTAESQTNSEWTAMLRMRGIKSFSVNQLQELPTVMGGGTIS